MYGICDKGGSRSGRSGWSTRKTGYHAGKQQCPTCVDHVDCVKGAQGVIGLAGPPGPQGPPGKTGIMVCSSAVVQNSYIYDCLVT